MKPRVPVGRALVLAALIGLAVISIVRRLGPPPIRSVAEPGPRATWYAPELGPPPGLRDDLIRRGVVPPDAIDDGQGRFVSPLELTEEERRAARAIVARRDARRAVDTSGNKER